MMPWTSGIQICCQKPCWTLAVSDVSQQVCAAIPVGSMQCGGAALSILGSMCSYIDFKKALCGPMCVVIACAGLISGNWRALRRPATSSTAVYLVNNFRSPVSDLLQNPHCQHVFIHCLSYVLSYIAEPPWVDIHNKVHSVAFDLLFSCNSFACCTDCLQRVSAGVLVKAC